MERETIERLAMDAAAEELSDDARLLLESYLAEHAEAQQWAREMTSIYEITQAAIEAKTEHAAPSPAETRRLIPLDYLAVARWAAVLAIAVFAGFSAGKYTGTERTDRPRIVRIVEPHRAVASVADLKAKYADTFWGRKVLASTEPRPRPRTATHSSTGNFWDIYRRNLKEKRYE
jgi:hypothetical protein